MTVLAVLPHRWQVISGFRVLVLLYVHAMGDISGLLAGLRLGLGEAEEQRPSAAAPGRRGPPRLNRQQV